MEPPPPPSPRPAASSQARWPEAIAITVSLWLFVFLIFLPLIIARYQGGSWSSVALDCSTFLMSILLALGMFLVFRRTAHWPMRTRTVVMVGTVILTAVLNTILDLLFQGLVAAQIDVAFANLPRDLGRAYPSALNYILVFGVNMALFQVSLARRAGMGQELQLSEARSAAQQAQLAALRYQLNPHFLFNALNSISALIVTRRNDDAERMTDKLSSFLRRSLSADPGELIPLDEELELTEEYLDIESVRFGERLKVAIDCSADACGALIPSFLIQPLVENAVKHGVARSRDQVRIDIGAGMADGHLAITVGNCVGDDPHADIQPGSGVGLTNVRKRLEAVYGKAASLTSGIADGRYVATILIPRSALDMNRSAPRIAIPA